MLKLIDANSPIQILATGLIGLKVHFGLKKLMVLVFSDVPENTVYKWTEAGKYFCLFKAFGLYRHHSKRWRNGVQWSHFIARS